jgi:uncharacterized membrane protein YphA (DoxX/SURF4 family)
MPARIKLRDIPTRLATGAYILHSGIQKWHGDEARATAIHGVAAGAFPFLRKVRPTTFLRLLSVGEMVTGGLLLAPFVPNDVAGATLTAFSGSLVAMYLRTPTMHEPGSVWPTPAGIGVSKDVWMLAIGLNLLADGRPSRAPN